MQRMHHSLTLCLCSWVFFFSFFFFFSRQIHAVLSQKVSLQGLEHGCTKKKPEHTLGYKEIMWRKQLRDELHLWIKNRKGSCAFTGIMIEAQQPKSYEHIPNVTGGENVYESNQGAETLMQVNRKPCGDESRCNSILKLETYGQTDSMQYLLTHVWIDLWHRSKRSKRCRSFVFLISAWLNDNQLT